MRADLIKTTIASVYRGNKRSICIEGAPGGGKTTIVRETARQLGIDYQELHMPTMLVEDFGVLYPTKDEQQLSYKLPEWWPMDPDSRGILCFDDRNQAGADLQKVLANIIQARTLHGHRLPDGWMVVSTGNRTSDRAGANKVLSHLRNRETVIEYDVHIVDWSKWAIDHGVKPTVVAFLNFRTGLLHAFDPNKDINPTPRSWVEGVADMIGVVPPEAEFECFKGGVGEGAAAEFLGYLKVYRQLPDPHTILADPDKAPVPTDPMTQYAIAGSLADFATVDNLGAITQYLDRMQPEFGVLCVTLAVRSKPELSTCSAFVKWAQRCDVLF